MTRRRLATARRWMLCIAPMLALTAVTGTPLRAETPPTEAKKDAGEGRDRPAANDIGRWVEQLGDNSFHLRSTAAERLLAAGDAAAEPLRAAAGSFDPEVRATARRLQVLIARAEFTNRLEAFAADTDGKRGETLPGWDQFRSLVGSDTAARELFVDMQRHEGAIIAQVFSAEPTAGSAEGPPVATPDQFAPRSTPSRYRTWEERLLRRQALQMIGRSGELASQLGSRVTMLFLASVPEGRISDAGAAQLVFMLQQPPLRESITTGPHHDAIRRLLTAWVFHCPSRSHEILKQRLDIASMHDLRDALPLALAVSNGDPEYLTVPPATRAAALLLVGQFGGAEHVAHLEPLLEDDSLCSVVRTVPAAGNPNGFVGAVNVEVRDVALATMLHLTGQNPAEYGFTNVMRQPPGLFNLTSLYLESDEKRQAAAEKWRAWRSQDSRAERGDPADEAAESSS